MASSASGQDEANRALWLAAGACHLARSGTTRCIPRAKFPQKPYNKSFIDQVCSVKMTGYWPRSFFASLWTSTLPRSINTQKKELGQYPAILTSHLINKPYKHVWNSGIEQLSRSYMGLFDINARKNRNTVLLGENFLIVHRLSLFSCDDKGITKQLKTTAHHWNDSLNLYKSLIIFYLQRVVTKCF